MPDLLDMNAARGLAARLKSVPGFPYDPQNVEAAAEDLVDWCRGAIENKNHRVWTPLEQATWLVNEVRIRWTERWLGPGMMLRIFRDRFEADKLGPERQVFDAAAMKRNAEPPNPEWSKRLVAGASHKDQLLDMRYQAIRDALYFTEGPGQSKIAGTGKQQRIDQGFWQDAITNDLKRWPEEVASIRAAIHRGDITAVPPDPAEPSEERRLLRGILAQKEVQAHEANSRGITEVA